MCSIFSLLFCLLCITAAQNTAAKVPNNSKSRDFFHDIENLSELALSYEQSEIPTNESYNTDDKPDLTCIAYGSIGCKITCDVIGQLYDMSGGVVGGCNAVKKCECSRPENLHLHALWKEKFQNDLISKRLLCIIDTDPDLADFVEEILQRCPRTPQDTIKDFEKELSNINEFQKLKPERVRYPLDHFASQYSHLVDKAQYILEQIKNQIPLNEIQNVDVVDKVTRYLKSELPDPKSYPEIVRAQLCQVNDEISTKILEKNFPDTKCDKTDACDMKLYDIAVKKVDSLVMRELTKSVNETQKKLH